MKGMSRRGRSSLPSSTLSALQNYTHINSILCFFHSLFLWRYWSSPWEQWAGGNLPHSICCLSIWSFQAADSGQAWKILNIILFALLLHLTFLCLSDYVCLSNLKSKIPLLLKFVRVETCCVSDDGTLFWYFCWRQESEESQMTLFTS